MNAEHSDTHNCSVVTFGTSVDSLPLTIVR
jgi:hypothetical protein